MAISCCCIAHLALCKRIPRAMLACLRTVPLKMRRNALCSCCTLIHAHALPDLTSSACSSDVLGFRRADELASGKGANNCVYRNDPHLADRSPKAMRRRRLAGGGVVYDLSETPDTILSSTSTRHAISSVPIVTIDGHRAELATRLEPSWRAGGRSTLSQTTNNVSRVMADDGNIRRVILLVAHCPRRGKAQVWGGPTDLLRATESSSRSASLARSDVMALLLVVQADQRCRTTSTAASATTATTATTASSATSATFTSTATAAIKRGAGHSQRNSDKHKERRKEKHKEKHKKRRHRHDDIRHRKDEEGRARGAGVSKRTTATFQSRVRTRRRCLPATMRSSVQIHVASWAAVGRQRRAAVHGSRWALLRHQR